VKRNHVLGLEAAGEADRRPGGFSDDLLDESFGGEVFDWTAASIALIWLPCKLE